MRAALDTNKSLPTSTSPGWPFGHDGLGGRDSCRAGSGGGRFAEASPPSVVSDLRDFDLSPHGAVGCVHDAVVIAFADHRAMFTKVAMAQAFGLKVFRYGTGKNRSK